MAMQELIVGFNPLVLGVVLLFFITLILLWLKKDSRLNTIDGPRGWPIIGIGFELPPKSHEAFKNWARQYGEIFKLRVGMNNWVVVNTPEGVKEIFDKQSIATSSKPPLPIAHDLLANGMRMFTMPYSPKWRTYRTIIHQLLSPKMTRSFIPSQEFEVKQLLYDLSIHCLSDNSTQIQGSADFYDHVRRFAYSIIMVSTYGRRPDSTEHADMQAAAKSLKVLNKISRNGQFIEDEIPFLTKLPKWMWPSRRKALQFAAPVLAAKMRLWDRLKGEVEAEKAPTCFAKELMLSDYTAQGLVDHDAAWICGGLTEVGTHTTFASINNLILYLAATPYAQTAANEELSRVIGDSRSPRFDDMPNLPYIHACVKEILRLCPVPTWGIKHYADDDITFKNHIIPKGTTLLANTHAIHNDPAHYDEPWSFKPERYLSYPLSSADYAGISDPYARDHFSFGVGRRICPGARLAENTLNIALANFLWAFEVKPSLEIGQDGKEREVKVDLSEEAREQSFFGGPKPFKVRIMLRNEERGRVIKEQWKRAEGEGYVLRGLNIAREGVVQ